MSSPDVNEPSKVVPGGTFVYSTRKPPQKLKKMGPTPRKSNAKKLERQAEEAVNNGDAIDEDEPEPQLPLQIKKKTLKLEHSDMVVSLNNLVDRNQGKYDETEPLYQVLAIKEEALGPLYQRALTTHESHFDTVMLLINLAEGNHDDAKAFGQSILSR